MNAIPAVGAFVGAMPEDRHAARVVAECLAYLDAINQTKRPLLAAAMGKPIGGNAIAQQKFIARVAAVNSPAVIEITGQFGKRCRFNFMLSIWERDPYDGALVFAYFAEGKGPGRVERWAGPAWRLSKHAMARMVQRCGCRNAFELLLMMRAMATPIGEGIGEHHLITKEGLVDIPFEGGRARLMKTSDSEIPVVVTVLDPVADEPRT